MCYPFDDDDVYPYRFSEYTINKYLQIREDILIALRAGAYNRACDVSICQALGFEPTNLDKIAASHKVLIKGLYKLSTDIYEHQLAVLNPHND